MNKSNLIWGVICLMIASGLAVVNLVLPPESLMFTVGERNMPWIPPIVLGIIGVVLLVSAYRKGEEKVTVTEQKEIEQTTEPQKAALNKRLETIFWGLFLIMLGGWSLIPDETIPKGAWSIGVGLLFLGLNAVRYLNGIRMSGFTTVLGILSVVGGIGDMLGWADLDGAILLIVLGAYLILKPWFEEKKIFGKAEQG